MFTNDMGFWIVDSMKENVHRAIEENTTLLEILSSIIDEEYFNMYEAFIAPYVVPSYGTSQTYASCIASNVVTMLNVSEHLCQQTETHGTGVHLRSLLIHLNRYYHKSK
jgi:hypothetical protein